MTKMFSAEEILKIRQGNYTLMGRAFDSSVYLKVVNETCFVQIVGNNNLEYPLNDFYGYTPTVRDFLLLFRPKDVSNFKTNLAKTVRENKLIRFLPPLAREWLKGN